MPATLTYSPSPLQTPAGILRADPCDPRRPMNPLAGIRATHRTTLGHREASPDGDGVLLVLDGSCSIHSHPTANYSLLTSNSSYTFSAKEKDSETGLSCFGSRYYSSDLSIWLSVDPMASKYPSLSPYTYCANNPVRVVDPNGEEIDPESSNLWNIMRFSLNVEKKIAKMCMQIEKSTHGMLCGGATDKYTAIDRTLTTMETMEVSSQVYKMSRCGGSVSSLKYNNKDNSLTVSFSNTSGFIHEITHCGQFEKGWIGFHRKSGLALSDIYDELEAYSNQAAYDNTSLPFSIIKPLTEDWVRNIFDGEKYPYKNCGISPTNRDSSCDDMRKAHPDIDFSFQGTISTTPIYKNMFYFKPKQ